MLASMPARRKSTQSEKKPHNQVGSWAIVAAVEGEQTHRLYVDESRGAASDVAEIRQVAKLVVKPGDAISLMPDGIHSILAGNKSLLHFHLYGKRFAPQSERREYDLDSGTVGRFVPDEIGFIEDAR